MIPIYVPVISLVLGLALAVLSVASRGFAPWQRVGFFAGALGVLCSAALQWGRGLVSPAHAPEVRLAADVLSAAGFAVLMLTVWRGVRADRARSAIE